ncbi:NACHT, LRR and PYD domains-containing protein 12-like isoform X2 [Alosa sapidissima]|uniref:NACHT, LRR and PYD domains-containing protein 12-like isoform X2 n=1 Tax=Alosa sapidissima TaxID=34773 RepID=UPI001C0A5AE3|nr:NACHT, LRR and PYD domains-containing protein 12-like isoform X2 [Alosa sapidissima]
MSNMEVLLDTLEELTAKELKKFKLFLTEETLEGVQHIPRGQLENADATDVTSKMRDVYGQGGALKVTLHVLKKMNHNELADRLEGELEKRVSRQDSGKGSEYAIRRQVSQLLKTDLKNKYASLLEGPEEAKVQLDEVYTDIHVTEGVCEEVNTQHEVQQIHMQTKFHSEKDIIIKCNDIMKSPPGKKVRTVMTTGIAGIGKSVCVQKFCLDWAEERANQDIDFIFVLPFRELRFLDSEQYSLPTLLLSFYPELTELNNVKIYGNSKILFIFDGLDESKLELNFPSTQKLHDLKQTSSLGKLLTNLIQGHLLRSSLIWITSRPAAANQIPSHYVDKWTEICGFNDIQKDEYFSKRMANSHTDKIISQIKTRCSLYIMCHIPVFCWILVCVLQDMLTPNSKMEIPTTMTELFIHFLLIQTNRKNQRCFGQSETNRRELLKRHKEHILRLSELAFKQLQKGNILFSQKDLAESGIVDHAIEEHSEMCTQIIKKDRTFYKTTFYCFVHLSVQEFLAALHVFHSFVSKNYKVLEPFSEQMCALSNQAQTTSSQPEDMLKSINKSVYMKSWRSLKSFFKPRVPHKDKMLGGEEWPEDSHKEGSCQNEMPLHVLFNGAVDKSLQFDGGHYDLFLRFLLGITLESNQDLLGGLLPQIKESSASLETTTKYIKGILSEDGHSVERCLNLFLCLLEMKNNSVSEEIEQYVISGKELTPAQCSLQAYILLMSEEVLDDFNLTMYRTSQEGRKRLLIVLRSCRKAQLKGCGLSEKSCGVISANLQSESACLQELDLSSNPLCDAGVERLSAGLKHTYCTLETLRLAGCSLSRDSCRTLSSVLQSESSQLRELDLSSNPLKDSGVELLSAGLRHIKCRLETLRLADCELTSTGCQTLALVLQSDNSHLKNLDLSNNDLTDSGVKELCAALGHRSCKLELLRLSGCLISQRGCDFIVSALTSNPDSLLTELDLSYTHPGDAGLQMLSTIPCGQMKVNAENSSESMLKRGLKKYACELTLDPDTAHRRLLLSEGNKKVMWESEKQSYPDHPDRFDVWPQVLSRQPLTGRCYWECEWSGKWADMGVAYESINRKGDWDDCGLGYNHKSWCLKCGNGFLFWHNKIKTDIPAPPSGISRVGVYLDREAGSLSFYRVSSDTLTHLHTFYSTLTDEHLYAGVGLWPGCTVSLCQIT